MALSVFGVYCVSVLPVEHETVCYECDVCGYAEQRAGLIVKIVFNGHFKCLISDSTSYCPGCRGESITRSAAFFGSSSEASLAIRDVQAKLLRAQYDKVLAGEPLYGVIPILPAKYDCPPELLDTGYIPLNFNS